MFGVGEQFKNFVISNCSGGSMVKVPSLHEEFAKWQFQRDATFYCVLLLSP